MRKLANRTWMGLAILAVAAPTLMQATTRSAEPPTLEQKVRHELLLLPFYNVFDNLEFRVDGSTVTLLGEVTQPVLKSDAETVVKGISGVQKVENEIQVLPLSPMDDRIRLAELRAIYRQPMLSRFALNPVKPIRIIVKNGHVTLDGVVDTEAEKNVATIQANSVPGVFSVTNNLRVVKS